MEFYFWRLRGKEQEGTKRQKKKSKKDLKRVYDEVEQEREKVRDLQRQIQPMKKEKEILLTRYISNTRLV